jgi:hypothetical protein
MTLVLCIQQHVFACHGHSAGIPWTSGVLYSQEQWDGVQQRIQAKEEADRRRLAKLRCV